MLLHTCEAGARRASQEKVRRSPPASQLTKRLQEMQQSQNIEVGFLYR